jgi:integrase
MKAFYVFKVISDYENKIGKDVYSFTKDEIYDVLLSFDTINLQELRHHLSVINNYTNWVAEKGLCEPITRLEAVNVRDLKLDDLMKKQIIKSPEQLYEIINNSYDLKQVPNEAVIIILLWIGVDSLDVRTLRVDDFEDKCSVLHWRKHPTFNRNQLQDADSGQKLQAL